MTPLRGVGARPAGCVQSLKDNSINEGYRARILRALEALGAALSGKGLRGEIFIVGGAAMALAYSTRRITKDIDAVFEPKSEIYEAAAGVAEEMGLPDDWLNDAANAFMPGRDAHEVQGIERSRRG